MTTSDEGEAPGPAHEPARLQYVDTLYAFAIVLVVLGHSLPWQWGDRTHPVLNALSVWIYSFHMPLFMFVSGFVFRSAFGRRSFSSYVAKRAQRLLLPYVSANALYFVSKWAFSAAAGASLTTGWASFVLYPRASHSINLWFLPTLFWIGVLLYPMSVLCGRSWRAQGLVALGLALLHQVDPVRDVKLFGADLVSHYAVYYWAGTLCFVGRDRILDIARRRWVPLILLGLHAASLYAQANHPWTALVGIFASLSAASAIDLRPASLVGRLVAPIQRYSYQIYLFSGLGHTPVRRFFTEVVPVAPALLVLLVFLGGSLAAAFMIVVFRRFLPVLGPLFGLSKPRGA